MSCTVNSKHVKWKSNLQIFCRSAQRATKIRICSCILTRIKPVVYIIFVSGQKHLRDETKFDLPPHMLEFYCTSISWPWLANYEQINLKNNCKKIKPNFSSKIVFYPCFVNT